MTIEDRLAVILREIEESLIFNKSILPALLKAKEDNIEVHIWPSDKLSSQLIKFEVRHRDFFGTLSATALVDPESVMTSVCYTSSPTKKD